MKFPIHRLTDQELLQKTKALAEKEREILTDVLKHLEEVNRRKLFSDLGYKSIFEYAVKELKYSEGQAGRRLQAVRLLQEIPEIKKDIENGSLNLSHISQVQSHFYRLKKLESKENSRSGGRFQSECKSAAGTETLRLSAKKELLDSVKYKSARETEKIISFSLSNQDHSLQAALQAEMAIERHELKFQKI